MMIFSAQLAEGRGHRVDRVLSFFALMQASVYSPFGSGGGGGGAPHRGGGGGVPIPHN